MKQRVITAVIIVAIVFVPVFFGGIPLELLALLIIGAGAYEWMHVHPNFKQWPKWLFPACAIAVVLSRFIPMNYLYVYYAFIIGALWSLPVFFENVTLNDMFVCMTYFVIFSLIYKAIGFIEIEHRYLWTICFATYGSDTFALLVGRKIGRHKMNPRISPKKSWEGFFGGVIGGFVLSLAVSMLYISKLNLFLTILLCLLCPVFAELGDLCFSAIKRSTNTKDFSNLLPGHGGILDRVDSLLMNVLLFGILFTLIV